MIFALPLPVTFFFALILSTLHLGHRIEPTTTDLILLQCKDLTLVSQMSKELMVITETSKDLMVIPELSKELAVFYPFDSLLRPAARTSSSTTASAPHRFVHQSLLDCIQSGIQMLHAVDVFLMRCIQMVRQMYLWLIELSYALRDRGCPVEVCHPLRHKYAEGSIQYECYQRLKEYEKEHGVPFGPIHQYLATIFAYNRAHHWFMLEASMFGCYCYVLWILLHILFPHQHPALF